MSKHYRIEKSQSIRKKRIAIAGGVSLLVIVFAVATYVYIDLNRNKLAVDDSQNKATLGVVNPIKPPYKVYENDKYLVRIPEDWRKVTNSEITVGSDRYYPESFLGTTGNHIGRKLDVYINTIPGNLGIDKVVAVTPVKNSMLLDEISSQCYYFTDVPAGKAGNNFPSTWVEKDIDFTCRSSVSTNVIGTLAKNSKQGDGVAFTTNDVTTKFFLVYTDHGSSQDNSIFFDIIDSFRVK